MGTKDTNREQIVFEGNNLANARSQVEQGATYIHVQ